MKIKDSFRYLALAPLLIFLPVLTPPTRSQAQNALPRLPGWTIVASKQSHSTQGQSRHQGISDDVVRLEANLVTVPTVVMDRDGRYITDLRREDFQIFEDGVEQDVAFFAPVEQPFTILFLLDTSSSMTPYRADLAQAANALLGQLRPDDQIIAASFYKWTDVLFKARVSELHKDIKLKFWQGADCSTMIYDVVDDALKRMKKIGDRKAIVLFSDGIGTGNFATAKSNLRDVEESDVLIYTVQFGTFPTAPPRDVSRKAYFKQIDEINYYMRDLAQRTGGRRYQVESVSDLRRTFGLVANELRRQYSLGYYPTKRLEAGQRRQIKVRVRLPNLVVRARDSYIVRPSQTSQK